MVTITNRDIITIFIYLAAFLMVLIVAKGFSWDKIINPKHKTEGIFLSIFVIVAIAFCLGSFINILIPKF